MTEDDELPEPPRLDRPVWVTFETTAETSQLLCNRCELQTVKLAKGDYPCLHIYGLSRRRWDNGARNTTGQLVIPCDYVTEIQLGPQVTLSEDRTDAIGVMQYDEPPAQNHMTVEEIEQALRETQSPG